MIDVVVAILAQLIMWPIRAGLALYFWQQIAAPRGWGSGSISTAHAFDSGASRASPSVAPRPDAGGGSEPEPEGDGDDPPPSERASAPSDEPVS